MVRLHAIAENGAKIICLKTALPAITINQNIHGNIGLFLIFDNNFEQSNIFSFAKTIPITNENCERIKSISVFTNNLAASTSIFPKTTYSIPNAPT